MTQATNKQLFNQNKRLIKAGMPEQSACPYCNAIMVKDSKCNYSLVSIDHITAYTKGGSDELENLIACCANCNSRKGNSSHIISFKLKTPKLLSSQEYMLLNDFLDVTNRLFVLREINKFLSEDNFEAAIKLAEDSQLNTTSKGFFNRVYLMLKDFLHDKMSHKQKIQKSQESIVIRIKAELDKMISLTEKTKYLDFVTYSLLS